MKYERPQVVRVARAGAVIRAQEKGNFPVPDSVSTYTPANAYEADE